MIIIIIITTTALLIFVIYNKLIYHKALNRFLMVMKKNARIEKCHYK